MREALMLFQQIVNSHYFRNAAIILFLNKMDLFKEKIRSGMSPISRSWPEYKGSPRDVDAGKVFFANKFRDVVKQNKEVYVHYTNATDTTLLKITMKSVQDMILQQNLKTLVL